MVVACGGARWNGVVEADEIARLLAEEGVPDRVIVRERASQDTLGNARCARDILGGKPVVVVTCSWHLPRARVLFQRAGLCVVEGIGVPPPDPSLLSRIYWRGREKVALWKDLRR